MTLAKSARKRLKGKADRYDGPEDSDIYQFAFVHDRPAKKSVALKKLKKRDTKQPK